MRPILPLPLGDPRRSRCCRSASPMRRRTVASGRAVPPTAVPLTAVPLTGVLLAGLVLLTGCTSDASSHADADRAGSSVGRQELAPGSADDLVAAATQLLTSRAAAAVGADRAAWEATIATEHGNDAGPTAATTPAAATPASGPSAGDTREQRLRDEFDVFSRLPWLTLRYEKPVVTDAPTTTSRGAAPEHAVQVTVVSQLRGVESTEQRATETFSLRQTRDGWRLSGHSDAPNLARPWLAPGAHVTVGRSSLVVGTADPATLERYAADADSAVGTVARLWPKESLPRPLVVVPATAADLLALRGPSGSATPQEVAAVTDGPVGADGRSTADRILLDPTAMGRLTEQGKAFVVTHELVHVAWRARTPGQAPIWLQEGFADWVGYDGSGLAPEVIAAAAVEEVRRVGAPEALPSSQTFAAAGTSTPAEYQRAWVLVSLLIEQHGLAKVLELIETATVQGPAEAAEQAADQALESVLGISRSDLIAAWRQRLDELAARSPATG